MINRDYATRVLFTLSFKDMCGYQLSKYIASKGERISNGTLKPVLDHLLLNDFVTFTQDGRRKVYSLTHKGEKYVGEIRSIRNEFKRRVLVDSMDDNAIFLDFFSNIEDATIFRELLEYLGDEIMSIVKSGFLMKKKGDDSKLAELKEVLKNLEMEVGNWHSPDLQN